MMRIPRICNSLTLKRVLSWIFIAFIGILLVEVMVVNVVLFKFAYSVKDDIVSFVEAPEDILLEKLMHTKRFKDFISFGRDGGFSKLIQESIERMYIISSDQNPRFHQKVNIRSLGIDVSHSGESLYLFKRIQSRQSFNYKNLVVDIGANDGLLSSNSYNFIHWGWSAILVEPQEYELNLAKLNNERHNDPYNEGLQKITLVQAVLSDKDGTVDFVTSKAVDKMESHIARNNENTDQSGAIKVVSMTVKTFAQRHHIPFRFGILSLDAEGLGNTLLRQWIELGYRPAYLIYESLHTSESIGVITDYLKAHDYRYLTKLGWNHILEHVPLDRN